MIPYASYCQIRSLRQEHKLRVGQIAQRLQLDKKTVRYWLKHEYHPLRRPGRGSKLDPHKPLIKGWLETHNLSAQQVLQRLQTQGVAIGYTVVREYVRLVRPKPVKAFLSLHFAPGECLQVDWGSWGTIALGATRRRLSFFAAVLGYSRMLYVEFTLGQSQELFLSCHQNAFAFFKGVPARVMVDYVTRHIIHLLFPPAICALSLQRFENCVSDGGIGYILFRGFSAISSVPRLPARWLFEGLPPKKRKPVAGTPAAQPPSFAG